MPSSILPYTIAPRTFFFYIHVHICLCAVCEEARVGATSTHIPNTSPLYERRECMCCYVNRVRLMSVPTYSLAPHILCSRPLRNLHHFHFILYIYILFCVALAVKKTFLIEPNTSQSFVVVVVLYSKLFSSSPTASQVERAGGAKGCAARARIPA